LEIFEVSGPTWLDAIGRLRARVWLETGILSPEFCKNGRWLDNFENASRHFVCRSDDSVVAASRLSIHTSFATTSHSEHLQSYEIPMIPPFALLSRLVVQRDFRERGIARAMDIRRIVEARAAEAKSVVVLPGPGRVAALRELGFEEVCVIPPDSAHQHGLTLETHVVLLRL
jgi:predicted GNAT family N-acyltransferase